jgi:hypothetical protein
MLTGAPTFRFPMNSKLSSHWPGAVEAIDDFQVPGDPEYVYDDYGAGKALTPAYIAPMVERFGLVEFFPSTRAKEETGLRRGCIVLAKNLDTIRRIEALPCLRRIDLTVLPSELPASPVSPV